MVSAPIIARFTGSAAVAKNESNYATTWKTERIVSIALMGLFPAAIIFPSPYVDTLLAISTTLHVYW